jgi:peptide/nickel transport system substrate-binding protein
MRRLAAALCAVALLAAACGDSDTPTESTVEDDIPTTVEAQPTTTTVAPNDTTTPAPDLAPAAGGTVIVADDQEPPVLNPFVPEGDNFIVAIIGQAHLAGAYDVDATTRELIPELVVELPTESNGGVTVNDDGTMTVKWTIRDEAVWSDGVPISGDDFAFTVEYRRETVACWEGLDRQPDPFLPDGQIESADAKTISIRFDQPGFQYETLFQWIVPQHAVAGTDYCNDWNDTMWPAAGPFMFSDWQQRDHIRLVRNPNYWKTDPATGDSLPYLDEVVFRFIPETEAIITAFKGREVDVIQPPPAFETGAALQALEEADVQILQGPIWEHFNFQFGPNNRNEDSMNESRSYRQAVAHAIDRNLLVREIYSGMVPVAIDGFLSTIIPEASSAPWSVYDYNPERAAALLATACEELERDCEANPPKLIFSTTSNGDIRVRLADLLSDMLAESGIAVELQMEDSALYFGETLEDGTWDVGLWAWVGNTGGSNVVGIFDLFDPDAPPPDGVNYYRWGSSDSVVRGEEAVDTFRTLLAELRSTYDYEEVKKLAAVLELMLAEEVVIIPLVSRLVMGAVWADELAGYVMNPTQASHTWNIEFWHRRDLG